MLLMAATPYQAEHGIALSSTWDQESPSKGLVTHTVFSLATVPLHSGTTGAELAEIVQTLSEADPFERIARHADPISLRLNVLLTSRKSVFGNYRTQGHLDHRIAYPFHSFW